MKRILFFLTLFGIASCTKEESTDYYAYLKNGTNHSVKVLPFRAGVVRSEDILRLAPDQEVLIAEGTDRGIVDHGGFTPDRFSTDNNDSTLVIFDSIYVVAHYVINPLARSSKYIEYPSIRNLLNYESYDYVATDPSKHRREAKYTYTFVEADYDFAK